MVAQAACLGAHSGAESLLVLMAAVPLVAAAQVFAQLTTWAAMLRARQQQVANALEVAQLQ